MIPRKSQHSFTPITLSILVILICMMAGITGVSAEKTKTNLTIMILPEDPTINQSFNVVGALKTVEGKSLGNKRITLETSRKNETDAGEFEYIGIKVTERNGNYTFFRPDDSPPEFLRAQFAGNDDYEPTTSPVIAVRGAGTDHPQKRTGTGSIMVYSSPEGADIYVDDIFRGITPNGVAGLSEGSHMLMVGKKGYPNQTTEVFVTMDRDATIDLSL